MVPAFAGTTAGNIAQILASPRCIAKSAPRTVPLFPLP